MKFKVSLSSEGMKQGFLKHFEKLLFGLVVVGFALFVWRSVQRETLTWGPEELSSKASAAQSTIAQAETRFPAEEYPSVTRYAQIATQSRLSVDEKGYKMAKELAPGGSPLWGGTLVQRPMPVIYPVRDLRVSAGHGAFAMNDPESQMMASTSMMQTGEESGGGSGYMMGGQPLKGQRWSVITGLIDWKKQREAYDKAFQDCTWYRPQSDFPQYAYYYVERAEIDPLDETAEPQWVRLNTRNSFLVRYYWQGEGPDVIDPFYLLPENSDGVAMAFPLGPLRTRAWGPEVAHAPEIEFNPNFAQSGYGGGYGAYGGESASSSGYPGAPGSSRGRGVAGAKKAVEEGAALLDEKAAKKAAEQKKLLADREAKRKAAMKKMMQPQGPDAPTAGGPMPNMMMPTSSMGSGEESYNAPETAMPGGMGSRPRMGSMPGMSSMYGTRRGMGMGQQIPANLIEEEPQEPEVALFRFFDFKVEPGKYYKYRVQILLSNPNYGVNPQFLENETYAKEPHLTAEWSSSSPTVHVPRDSQVLTVSVRPDTAPTRLDLSAKLMLASFNYQDGEVAFEEFDVQRGQLLNFRQRDFTSTTGPSASGYPGTMQYSSETSSSGMPSLASGGKAEPKKVDYLSEMALVDASGGVRLPREKSLNEPAYVLLLDPDGKLVVRDEISDLEDVQRYKPSEQQAAAGSYYNPPSAEEANSLEEQMYEPPGTSPKRGRGRKPGSGSMMPGGPPGSKTGKSGAKKGAARGPQPVERNN